MAIRAAEVEGHMITYEDESWTMIEGRRYFPAKIWPPINFGNSFICNLGVVECLVEASAVLDGD